MRETEIIELTKLAPPKRTTFGEFLVRHHIIDRAQLFRALQLKDRMPAARLGWCAAVLGYAPRSQIESMHTSFAKVADAELETMRTEAFEKEFEIDRGD